MPKITENHQKCHNAENGMNVKNCQNAEIAKKKAEMPKIMKMPKIANFKFSNTCVGQTA